MLEYRISVTDEQGGKVQVNANQYDILFDATLGCDNDYFKGGMRY